MNNSQLEDRIDLQVQNEILATKHSFTKEERRLRRLLEIIPGFISWSLILFPVIVSPFNPYIVGAYILIFDTYWFIKAVRLGIGSAIAYRKILNAQKINWMEKLDKENIPYKDIIHVVVIPEALEPIDVLRKNINCILKQELSPLKHIIVVIASEKVDPNAENKFKELYKEYKSYFKDFLHTIHTLEIGEIKGKNSNMRHASLELDKYLIKNKYNYDYLTITSSDADSQLPTNYFSQLTYIFYNDPERKFHFYHSAMIYLANALEVPFPNRVFAAGSSINNISHLMYDDLIPVSTYTAMFSTLKEAGFWSVDVIPEDFHMFFKTFFKHGPKVKTIPVYSVIYSDAAQGSTFFKGLKANYTQMVRWAWGVSDDPYIIKSFFKSDIPFFKKLRKIFRPLEEHFLWPVNWFIITIGTNIPFWLNTEFKHTAFSSGMLQMTQVLITSSLIFIFIMIFIQIKLIIAYGKKLSTLRKIFLALEWMTLPVTSFFFSMLPGLEAHTRLMFGKYLSYIVTEKKA
jgi:hypothetical protein